MQVKYVRDLDISWKNVFNSDLKRWGYEAAFTAAKESGYPFIVWNGWVYDVDKHSIHESERIIES